MSELKEFGPAIPTKEQAIMAIAGAFNLAEMYSLAGLVGEVVATNQTLQTALLFTAEFFYSNNLFNLATDLYAEGIISDLATVQRLVPYVQFDAREKNREAADDHYPIVGIVGRGNAGKETIGDMIGEMYDSYHFTLANRLREVAMTLGVYPPFTLPFLRAIDAEIKPKFGKETFVRWTLDRAKRMTSNAHTPEIISVDGFRSVEETEWFLNQPNTMLVAVTADAQLRFQRGINRNRAGEDAAEYREFEASDVIEGAWIDPIISMAEHTFTNNDSLESLKSKVKNYFSAKLVK